MSLTLHPGYGVSLPRLTMSAGRHGGLRLRPTRPCCHQSSASQSPNTQRVMRASLW